jgi:peptidoglycan biosynthesis protein MviN/MurJ (putative lipid II flippase)
VDLAFAIAVGSSSGKRDGVSERKIGLVEMSVGIARGILRDRATRRKWLSQCLMLALGLMAVGLWLINGWLQQSVLRFALWWGAVGLITVFVMLFALYDALAVFREERDKIDPD